MDPELFQKSPFGTLVPISGPLALVGHEILAPYDDRANHNPLRLSWPWLRRWALTSSTSTAGMGSVRVAIPRRAVFEGPIDVTSSNCLTARSTLTVGMSPSRLKVLTLQLAWRRPVVAVDQPMLAVQPRVGVAAGVEGLGSCESDAGLDAPARILRHGEQSADEAMRLDGPGNPGFLAACARVWPLACAHWRTSRPRKNTEEQVWRLTGLQTSRSTHRMPMTR